MRAPEPGVHEFTGGPGGHKLRHIEHFHDAAIAAGFESEMQEFADKQLGRWWIVNIRKPGDTEPAFVSDRP